ncbi:hypothetical protein OH76DRAFT_132894 [Lentinus brumalis]|uniref:F-box domain-containing protein n=1 Tax=Lentinus brumalis TaxID=2498619 RepID=A0A371DK24_9APHY|nr:hypothetical protein OH76DRAFT_132894 [Polyporus brumalis]
MTGVFDAYQAVRPFPAFDAHLTAEDRSHLAGLDSRQVQRWTRMRIKELMNRVRSLSSVCNAAAPMNCTLPPDVLLEVFSYLEPSFERCGQLNALHVCRLWRHLLLRSTSFWVKAVGEFRDPDRIRPDGVLLFQSSLQRTRHSPLILTLDYINSKVARTLVPCASHIVSLAIALSPGGLEFVHAWLERESLPLLEDLAISHSPRTDDGTSSHPKLVLRRRFPRLRTLQYPISPLDVSSITDQLRELALTECNYTCNFSQAEDAFSLLMLTLERCTSLESFRLDVSSYLVLQAADNRTISLPALRQLRIQHSHTSDFLMHLAIPDACAIELDNTTTSGYSNTAGLHGLLPRNFAAFPQLTAADRVRARLLERRTRGRFEAYAHGSKILSLECHLFKSYMPGEFRHLLRCMPRLRSVEIDDDARNISLMLSDVFESGSRVCPELEELDALWLCHNHGLFEEVETRQLASMSLGYNSEYRCGPIVLEAFCACVRRMLLDRAAAGSARLRKLHVRIPVAIVSLYIDKESWQPPVLKERMLAQLGADFGGELAVSFADFQ